MQTKNINWLSLEQENVAYIADQLIVKQTVEFTKL